MTLYVWNFADQSPFCAAHLPSSLNNSNDDNDARVPAIIQKKRFSRTNTTRKRLQQIGTDKLSPLSLTPPVSLIRNENTITCAPKTHNQLIQYCFVHHRTKLYNILFNFKTVFCYTNLFACLLACSGYGWLWMG